LEDGLSRIFNDPPDKVWEDFELGDVMVTRGRTIDMGDIANFTNLTGDFYPIHIDEEFAKAGRFGTRISHGPFTFAIAVGLVGMSGFYGNAIIALIELVSLKALKPVLAGDTLKVRAEVTELSAGTNPKYGTISVLYSVGNQRDEEVMSFTQKMLARRKEASNG
jgi:3-hydroxybutyryl-CoA dehydratase